MNRVRVYRLNRPHLAKNAATFSRISFSCSSLRTRLRSSLSSARSALLRQGPIARLDLVGVDPVGERLLVDRQITCDLRVRAPGRFRGQSEAYRLAPEFVGIVAALAHLGLPYP